MSAARHNAACGLRSAIVVLIAAAACTREDKPEAGRGVEVVENQAAAWNARSAWRIEPTPLLSIGQLDGASEYQFFRVLDTLRLEDGTIVVANNGTNQVRYYDRTGKLIRSIGGSGSGPGEYVHLRLVRRFGVDSLITWDTQLSRGTVLTRDGRYARTVTPPAAKRFSNYVGVFADRSLLGLRYGIEMPVEHAAFHYSQGAKVKAQDVLAFRLTAAGSADSIGKFFLSEMFVSPDLTTELPFGRVGVFAAAPESFYYGSGESFEIRQYSTAGKLMRVLRAARPNPPLTRALIDSFVVTRRARARDASARQSVERLVSSAPLPATIPAFSDIIVDAGGNLWVGAYHLRESTATRWTVFDRKGDLLGDLAVPAGLTIYDIGNDYILGRTRDELDVERVVLYRLLKPASP